MLLSFTGSIDDSVIVCDKNIEVIKTIPTKAIPTKTTSTNFKEKKVNCKTKNVYVLLTFLLITTTVLIPVSI